MTAVTQITADPDPAIPSTFAAQADALWPQVKTAITEMNVAFAALNLVSVSDTSSTSNAIDVTGNKTFTVSAGKSFLPGQYLNIADTAAPTTNSFLAQVFSYSGTTLVVTPVYVRGSGTKTAWTISLGNAPQPLIARASILHLSTGNDHGSTNLKIRRVSTTITNTATADLTYADSATLGMSVTVVTSGLYNIKYTEMGTSSASAGVSVNSNQLTTNFTAITAAHVLLQLSSSYSTLSTGNITTYLTAGDVLRMHTISAGSGYTDSNASVILRIERLI